MALIYQFICDVRRPTILTPCETSSPANISVNFIQDLRQIYCQRYIKHCGVSSLIQVSQPLQCPLKSILCSLQFDDFQVMLCLQSFLKRFTDQHELQLLSGGEQIQDDICKVPG